MNFISMISIEMTGLDPRKLDWSKCGRTIMQLKIACQSCGK